jgi:hypothetical protein
VAQCQLSLSNKTLQEVHFWGLLHGCLKCVTTPEGQSSFRKCILSSDLLPFGRGTFINWKKEKRIGISKALVSILHVWFFFVPLEDRNNIHQRTP